MKNRAAKTAEQDDFVQHFIDRPPPLLYAVEGKTEDVLDISCMIF